MPFLTVKPSVSMESLKYLVFLFSLSIKSKEDSKISRAFIEAQTTPGASELLNKYGRERCLNISTIS